MLKCREDEVCPDVDTVLTDHGLLKFSCPESEGLSCGLVSLAAIQRLTLRRCVNCPSAIRAISRGPLLADRRRDPGQRGGRDTEYEYGSGALLKRMRCAVLWMAHAHIFFQVSWNRHSVLGAQMLLGCVRRPCGRLQTLGAELHRRRCLKHTMDTCGAVKPMSVCPVSRVSSPALTPGEGAGGRPRDVGRRVTRMNNRSAEWYGLTRH
ncbi:hypothetical protein AAFF_G00113690 [Aldrovandia affinis]|uniref:Uncharacterized protein n=1 Tax=Aldrovandia affinis TaxID=143900 RepID=A0AAD7RTF7_9TELE|nr:hypothetical protein AAFF_G00113690 [Aldrovandia affinis]